MKLLGKMLLLSASFVATAAHADAIRITPDNLRSQAHPYITTARESDLYNANSLVPSGGYSGVGALFITVQSTASTGFGFICTGALVSSNVVLTAGHCLAGEPGDAVIAVDFFLPNRVDAGRVRYSATSWEVNPNYNGDVLAGNDVALFTLADAPADADVYGLYTGNPLDAINTRVGTGTIGTGADGTFEGAEGYDGLKRYGYNQYEFYGEDVFAAAGYSDYYSAPEDSILMYDFDSGLANNDVFGKFMGKPGLGVFVDGQERDVAASPGDSGGPIFINGLIAGITSFGITGAIFDGFCGTDDDGHQYTDPSFTGNDCTNSSFGELGGDTRTATYADYINGYIARAGGAVPEPASWALMILGFGAVGGALRRSAKMRDRTAVLG